MTRDDIISMAQQTGLATHDRGRPNGYAEYCSKLERFAALAAAAEREACAKVCEKGIGSHPGCSMWGQGYDSACRAHAAVIRARGADLLHLIQFAQISCPSEGDDEQVRLAMKDIGAMLAAAPKPESCGACGDACTARGSCRVADESPTAEGVSADRSVPSLGIPSCGGPLCREGDHHPLCKFSPKPEGA